MTPLVLKRCLANNGPIIDAYNIVYNEGLRCDHKNVARL